MFEFSEVRTVVFPYRTGDPVDISTPVPFSRPIRAGSTPVVLITGFRYEFQQLAGHHPIGKVTIDAALEGFAGAVVTVRTRLGVRDWSPTDYFWNYGGSINFIVIADLE